MQVSSKRFFMHTNCKWPIVYVLLLSIVGVLILYSAGIGTSKPWAINQLNTAVVGMCAAIIISQIRMEIIIRYAYYIYLFTIVLLVLVALFGHTAMGAKRWLSLGPINLQPSEFVKVGLVLALAKFYHKLHFFDSVKVQSIFAPLFMVLVPFVLISKQPNLSTAGLLFLCFVCISFASGINFKIFAASMVCGILSMPFSWLLIHDYQKLRILTFLNPERDPFGAGYNIIQSKIAIGSGGFWGKGLFLGSQGQLEFLPEKHTDFIISLLGEECGFIGVTLVIGLTGFLIVNLYLKSLALYSHFARLVVVGFCSLLFFHVLINIAMISGLFPAAGLPYPFLSYGRSSALAMYILFGIVLSAINHFESKLKNV